ncbi:hypothetical protein ACHWQZ_G009299 [Mnemiopsis leidyi]
MTNRLKEVFGLCYYLAACSFFTLSGTLNVFYRHPLIMVNDTESRTIERRIIRLSESLAHRKTQLHLLRSNISTDLFSSIRPKIGKKFHYDHLEDKKLATLAASRTELINIGIEESVLDLAKIRKDFRDFFLSLQLNPNITSRSYLNYTNLAFNMERVFIQKFSNIHLKKINVFCKKNGADQVDFQNNVSRDEIQPEKRVRHKVLKKLSRKRRKKNYLQRRRQEKEDELTARIKEIKQNNQVINLSSVEVPDDVYLYLALGSTFVPHKKPSAHDLIYDTKMFSRKLAWQAFFKANPGFGEPKDNGKQSEGLDLTHRIEDLRPPGTTWPQFSSKLLEEVNGKLNQGVSDIIKNAKQHSPNLTHREAAGLKWCIKHTRERVVYISEADKGGAILILNSTDVDRVIRDNLDDSDSFTRLNEDPRSTIRKELIQLLKRAVCENIIPPKVLYYITGVLEHEDKNDGYSHSKVFQIAIPYLYPLFKLHKLSKEAIAARTIPPSRMVTGATNGPTYRLCQYTELILKDVVSKYCAPEMLKDSTSFIKFIEENRIMLEQSARYVCTLDVVALYPSIPKEQALLAVDHALSLAGIDDAKKTFVDTPVIVS